MLSLYYSVYTYTVYTNNPHRRNTYYYEVIILELLLSSLSRYTLNITVGSGLISGVMLLIFKRRDRDEFFGKEKGKRV